MLPRLNPRKALRHTFLLGLFACMAHLSFAARIAAPQARQVCDVARYGAVGDGKRLETASIQAAIADCASRPGGGVVRLGAGTYRSGSLRLLSNITLQLDRGARLLGSERVEDYTSVGRSSENRSTALLWAIGAHNIAVTGDGVIDGNGRAFVRAGHLHHTGGYDPAATRQGAAGFAAHADNRDGPIDMAPRPGVLVLFIECEHVAIRGVRVVDAPNWCIHLACCRQVSILGIDVRNSLLIPNADAIDVSNCQGVRIAHVYLEAGDDGIAISPCADGYCHLSAQDIHVSDAVIVSRSAGIRLGWAAEDIRDIHFDHVTIRNSNRGIGIFVRGNEHIHDISFRHMDISTGLVDGDWWGMGEPIHITVAPWKLEGAPGSVSGLLFENIRTHADSPIIFTADQPGGIRDVTFHHVSVSVGSGPLTARYGGNLDLRPVDPPERGIAALESAAIVLHHVDHVILSSLFLRWNSSAPDFFAAGLLATDFRDLSIDRFTGSGARMTAPALLFQRGTALSIRHAHVTSGKLIAQDSDTASAAKE